MRIERVDDKTVKCFLSNEELEKYNIDYKDFLNKSDKAREVVMEIMHQATEEVGYRPPKFAFDLQIMVTPDQGLVLILSEKDPLESKEGAQLMEYLKEMKRNLFGQTEEEPQKGVNEKQPEAQPAEPAKQPGQVVFVFASLKDVIGLAQVVPKNLRIKSALYSMQGEYFLAMEKGTAAYKRYSKTCIQAMEFGRIYDATPEGPVVLQEHGECLIAENALRKLHL